MDWGRGGGGTISEGSCNFWPIKLYKISKIVTECMSACVGVTCLETNISACLFLLDVFVF